MEETDEETVSRKKMKPASRYKKWLESGGGRGACAHKTTATAIFKPVSHAWQPRAGLQWRKADQPTEMA